MPLRQGEEGAAPSGQEPKFDDLPSVQEARDLLDPRKQKPAAAPQAPEPDEGLPEKYRGKSLAEMARMLEDSQSMIGRQSHEIGSLRSLVDQALDLKRTQDLRNNGGQPEPEITADDVLAAPKDTIGRVAQQTVKPIEERLSRLEESEAEAAFLRLHPTAQQDAKDPAFLEYVGKSAYRRGLAERVAKTKDIAAAHELFLSWEESKLEQQARDQSPQADKSRKTPSKVDDAPRMVRSGGTAEPSGIDGKVYSRQALMKMRVENPDGYYDPAFQAIIMKAYGEGRVK